MCRWIMAGLLSLASTASMAAPGTATVTSASLERFAASPVGARLDIAEFPSGPAATTRVAFERIEVYAPGARIIEITPDGERDLPRSTRVHLYGEGADGSRIVLSFDPELRESPSGSGSGPSGGFVLRGERVAQGWQLRALTPEDALPRGVKLDFGDGIDSITHPDGEPGPFDHLATPPSTAAASTPARLATVAVDTDTQFVANRFSGNTTQATAWIADLFAEMNVIYRRDLNVILVQGTTILRTGSDPYSQTGSPASGAHLNEFGNYWAANYGSVSRSFAMLLSGVSPSPNSASGIAWVNSYCRTQGSGGSYSVNQIFTGSNIPVASSAFIVAHELGHNFGASHTHCSSASNGTAPVASGTIDQCYSGEGGCFSGTTSCPSSGPGAPRGTLMSYCHIGSNNCGQNVLQFHPTHVTQLLARVAANTPTCLRTETIFTTGFQ